MLTNMTRDCLPLIEPTVFSTLRVEAMLEVNDGASTSAYARSPLAPFIHRFSSLSKFCDATAGSVDDWRTLVAASAL
ncbi:hypothetical protein D3C71_1265240 [compost metagenome]